MTGPVFNRVWDTPDNGYAEKFKHAIEPYLNVAWTSAIANYQRTSSTSIDQIVGGSTGYTYGLSNRFYAKRRPAAAGQTGQAREIFTVELQQTYHSNERATQVDPQYSTSNSGAQASSLLADPAHRARAADAWSSTRRPGRNSTAGIGSFGRFRRPARTPGARSCNPPSAGARERSSPELAGFNNPDSLNHSVNVSSTVRTRDNKYGSVYSFNYDVLRETMIQQRISAFYNAQCCGIAFEFQKAGCFAGHPTAAFSCPLRWPASATSRRSTARSAACRADAAGRSPQSPPGTRALSFCDLCG